ncbi:hypothetical protein PR202_ga02763 [Eleusine coracana subsp. coracana]|uniref:HMA domain-containing protein n=1 Tax=Eleusine coracana subsp. coracana TaxID=191504 RepID=A0AAV5BKB8_ELECO|nr:hypothetical protein PR202_ga02763 [Eleusine coracana subsp. coracana]
MRQLCGFLGGSNGGQKDKKKVVHRRQVQTVELKVRMDCQRCEREVKKALTGLRGVQHVEVNRLLQKVTVTGEVDPPAVLRRAQSTGKKAEPWPQNPCRLRPGGGRGPLRPRGGSPAPGPRRQWRVISSALRVNISVSLTSLTLSHTVFSVLL